MNQRITAIIPARYASTRLPGKPLVDIAGRPMILHVVERAKEVASISRVIVATDDVRVLNAVIAAGEEAMMTSPAHVSGTDRLAEVAGQLDADIIVNIQGDEPLIAPATIEAAIAPLVEDTSLLMATTCEPIESVEDLLNLNVVKVVTDNDGFALYFSRSPIPFPRADALAHGSSEAALRARPELLSLFAKHTGMYVYRRDFLLKYAGWESTPLERAESLEQLRVLEHGCRIRVVRVAHRSPGVDTPEDLERVRSLMKAQQLS
ncbi:MAG TPA: 3-deoxy-manno-octulosonate cytidylyltransferase [Blastocatellia bacterium]|nr:3-deoxy-manno-octulosonate cytidylyltransferase [Blastocatellia bacterium]